MKSLLHSMSALSGLLFLMVLVSLRRAHIRVEYSVSWLLASVALLFLSLSPGLLTGIASFLDIAYAPIALIFVIGGIFILLFFRLSVIISKLKDDNIAMAQRLAILEYYVRRAAKQ